MDTETNERSSDKLFKHSQCATQLKNLVYEAPYTFLYWFSIKYEMKI